MTLIPYEPPFKITKKILTLVAEISEMVGQISGDRGAVGDVWLRRRNQILTIQSSLAIERNSLSVDEVTEVINGKRVVGDPEDILEVQNAYQVYERLLEFDPYSLTDLLKAHQILMAGLIKESGQLRSVGVGVFGANHVVHHIAPPPGMVPKLVDDLLNWGRESDVHPLIKSSVTHYELEFIHPFVDGNGRLGRLWQTLILSQWRPFFACIAIETLVFEYVEEYYEALNKAEKNGESTIFIEFTLKIIFNSLKRFVKDTATRAKITPQIQLLLTALGEETLSAKRLLERMNLTHRQHFMNMYLKPALALGVIEMTRPEQPTSRLQKYRRVIKL
ncbi:MAG: Fic family protein [Deltaproteobacteria bacterium]|jgi:Fic family protein|nr:Fic family protein [Deltaproteobacteria bacterium]